MPVTRAFALEPVRLFAEPRLPGVQRGFTVREHLLTRLELLDELSFALLQLLRQPAQPNPFALDFRLDRTLRISKFTTEQYQKVFRGDSRLPQVIGLTVVYVFGTLAIFNVTFGLVLALTTTSLNKVSGGFFRGVWAQGKAGVEVPLTIFRDGHTMELRVKSGERDRFLKGPSLH